MFVHQECSRKGTYRNSFCVPAGHHTKGKTVVQHVLECVWRAYAALWDMAAKVAGLHGVPCMLSILAVDIGEGFKQV
jgi:hypothetical protein